MSKILRRPMFRGGGQVSSYGKGIAAPLVPGYQMGGNVSGGIVNLPGGYAETANQRLLNNINNDDTDLYQLRISLFVRCCGSTSSSFLST